MDLHLYEMHKGDLLTDDMFDKNLNTLGEIIGYLLRLMKKEAIRNGRYFGSENSTRGTL